MPEPSIYANREIVDYISKFSANQKEVVLQEILKSAELEKYLSTVEGRLVLDKVLSDIRDYTMQIVRFATEGGDGAIKMISLAALKINIAYQFMHSLAVIANGGIKHEEGMKAQ